MCMHALYCNLASLEEPYFCKSNRHLEKARHHLYNATSFLNGTESHLVSLNLCVQSEYLARMV